MSLSPEAAEPIVATCRQNAVEIAAALSRAFDGAFTIAADDIVSHPFTVPLPDWNGPGVAIALQLAGAAAALVLIPEGNKFLPLWAKNPDATGVSKLNTLAQELGHTLLPEEHMPSEFFARHVERLAETVASSGVASPAAVVKLTLDKEPDRHGMYLVWPATNLDAFAAHADPHKKSQATDAKLSGETLEAFEQRLADLPPYVRSLLRIRVPVSVMLASARQPVARILNIGPGSIIQFDKHCEQPLMLSVGNQNLAEGEAVKVGEKFGIKITSMILPGERFFALRGGRNAARATSEARTTKTK
jgi:flagellar motor switch protein FliN